MGSSFFQEKPLEELVDVYDSLRKPVTASDRKPGPYPYYGASGITDYVDSFIFDGEYLLLSEDGDNLRTQNTPIAFMATGKFWVNNHAHILQANANNCTKYVCNALQIADVTSYISGSTRPKLNQKDMRRILVYAPPLPEQRAIAHILGSLDDKIELNRRMNETLEGMAQALFKSWFVDFDPVIDNAIVAGNAIPEELADRAEVRRAALANGTANREAAKPFPARFQQTEELGWIPFGWEVGPVLRQAKLLSGGTPKTSEDSYWDGHIKWASAKDVSQCGKAFLTETERTITQEGLDNSSTKVIPRFSTVIVSRGATTGRMAMFGDDIAMNQTCYALRFNTGHHFYGYCHARHFIDSLVQTAHGSVFDTITTKTFESSNVILASSATSGLFENAVQSLFGRILTNEHATQSLTKLRDTLLPKHISGELRIPDAEKLAESALA